VIHPSSSTVIPDITRNAVRQSAALPRYVAAGTPADSATGIPAMATAIARPSSPAGASLRAYPASSAHASPAATPATNRAAIVSG
jgi:hypothetical protein